jgi:hypothetical protein
MARKSVGSKSKPSIDLRALEEEVLAEGKDWMKLRMEEKLRDQRESFSPGGEDASSKSPAPEADA